MSDTDKLYTFLDCEGEIIQQVRANHHSQAVKKANPWMDEDDPRFVDSDTDFYSEELED